VVDAGGFERVQRGRRDGNKNHGFFKWFKNDRRVDHDMRTTAKTSVSRV
jgi:hypothetical protein